MSRDLLRSDDVRDLVREAYAGVAATRGGVAERLYGPDELALVPKTAVDYALGVGNHLRHARLRAGDTVLDLGSGAGIDTILVAHRIGPNGRAIALDFLPDMLERTRAAAAEAGLANVETLEAEIEAIPLPEGSVDAIVSNGVVNLAPRKSRVLAECARVLRRGGELCVSDLTVDEEELPAEVLMHPATWAG